MIVCQYTECFWNWCYKSLGEVLQTRVVAEYLKVYRTWCSLIGNCTLALNYSITFTPSPVWYSLLCCTWWHEIPNTWEESWSSALQKRGTWSERFYWKIKCLQAAITTLKFLRYTVCWWLNIPVLLLFFSACRSSSWCIVQLCPMLAGFSSFPLCYPQF